MRAAFAVLPAAAVLAACNATTAKSDTTVGPLYLPGVAAHTCTASVVNSPTHDLLITAAHCFAGPGTGMTFVPGSVNGSAPAGRWMVMAAYADPAWTARRDPLHDVAFLRVAPQLINGAWHHIQDLTGGNQLIRTPSPIGFVQVPAYPFGIGGSPITCIAKGYWTGRYPSFDCGGYVSGTSGAPWVRNHQVLGVIGGLHQGGCLPSTSYSPPFDASTLADYQRAASNGPADVLPIPGSDGC